MTIIGYKRNNFAGKDNRTIEGYDIYISHELSGDDADGISGERIYMTDAKLARTGYVPHVGDVIDVSYDWRRKPQAIYLRAEQTA